MIGFKVDYQSLGILPIQVSMLDVKLSNFGYNKLADIGNQTMQTFLTCIIKKEFVRANNCC